MEVGVPGPSGFEKGPLGVGVKARVAAAIDAETMVELTTEGTL